MARAFVAGMGAVFMAGIGAAAAAGLGYIALRNVSRTYRRRAETLDALVGGLGYLASLRRKPAGA